MTDLNTSSVENEKMGQGHEWTKGAKGSGENPSPFLDLPSLPLVSPEKRRGSYWEKRRATARIAGIVGIQIPSLKPSACVSTLRSVSQQQIWTKEFRVRSPPCGVQPWGTAMAGGGGDKMSFRRVREALWGFPSALIYAILCLKIGQ